MLKIVAPKVKYCISSHVRYFESCLPPLLESMNEIASEDIVVTICGSDVESTDTLEGIQYHFVRYNAYEYSSLINILDKKLHSDYWFLLHDTTVCGPRFAYLSRKVRHPCDAMLPSKFGKCNLGALSINYIYQISDFLTSLRNIDKSAAIKYEGKRGLFAAATPRYYYGHESVIQDNEMYSVYGGKPRRRYHFESVDLYKYIANVEELFEQNIIVNDP